MVSTVAGGDVSGYVGEKDIVMAPAIVDLAGLNRISRGVLARAVGAICGMVETEPPTSSDDKPLIAASMFGNTTRCVQAGEEEVGAVRVTRCSSFMPRAAAAGRWSR